MPTYTIENTVLNTAYIESIELNDRNKDKLWIVVRTAGGSVYRDPVESVQAFESERDNIISMIG